MPMNNATSDKITGKTVRLTWTSGPTKGSAHEHVFHHDGTVEWRALDKKDVGHSEAKASSTERASYMARDITEQVVLVSYLSSAGYTLTVILNFRNQTMDGVASNEKTWTPVEGTFEIEHAAAMSVGGA